MNKYTERQTQLPTTSNSYRQIPVLLRVEISSTPVFHSLIDVVSPCMSVQNINSF